MEFGHRYIAKKWYIPNIFTTLLYQIISDKLLLVLIWTYNLNYYFFINNNPSQSTI